MDSRPKFQSTASPKPGSGILCFFFICVLLTNLVLLGETLWRFHLSTAVVFTLLLYAIWRLSAGLSEKGFTLDDSLKALITGAGKMIPYSTVRSIQLCQAPDLLTVRLLAGPLRRRRVILRTSAAAETQRLTEALKQRELSVAFKPSRLRQRTQEWLLMMVMPLTILVMLWFTFDLYRKIPNLRTPTKTQTPAAAPWTAETEHTLDGTVFYIPDEFIIKQNTPDQITFRDLKTQSALGVSTTPFLDLSRQSRLNGQLLQFVGLRDDYAWLSIALQSRVGLVPLIFKSSLLGIFQRGQAEVFGISAGPFQGFLLQGPLRRDMAASGRIHRCEIILTDRSAGRYIRFTISGSRSTDKRFLDRLIAGLG